mmetsp:Transcript_19896/g.79425  ORF Transcript_19896/g.79425 Transcript_19896/m.79425 type:complete len:964 (-) Transcript_19896:362-3253(-)
MPFFCPRKEWPNNWRNFTAEIVGASRTSTSQCENNLRILALLSEEVFQFSSGQMTQEKTVHLKNQFNDEFSQVFELCQFVFSQSASLSESKPSLLISTLQTLEKFLVWIPLGYIFETELIETLTSYLSVAALRNPSLKCLVEIGSLAVGGLYDNRFSTLYMLFISQLSNIVPVTTDIASAYEEADDDTQAFVMDLALFFSGFFKGHLQILESGDADHIAGMKTGMEYMLKISTVNDVEVFKACVEWWHNFSNDLYYSTRVVQPGLQLVAALRSPGTSRKDSFAPICSDLRRVMISRMAKPEEVLIVEDENGEIVRETSKDTDTIALYRTMKEILVYLTHLDSEDTDRIMLKKLASQMDRTEWSWHNLNTLCWAVGSISGAMTEAQEKKFLVIVIKELLQLCEIVKGKDNKAVVASNIMYVVGQYPRFLRAHWKFLKTVVNKQFEFMLETHPGVQDMACDTFMKIAQKCRKKFVAMQQGENKPFIDEIILGLPGIIEKLEPHQIHSFYESCGCILAEPTNWDNCSQQVLKLFKLPNETWQDIIYKASVGPEVFQDREVRKKLVNILKTNTRVAKSLGVPYYVQLKWMFPEMLNVYVTFSKALSEMVKTMGPVMTRSADARSMRAVKKEVLRLLEAFYAHDDGSNKEVTMQTLIEPMTEPILGDYYNSVPETRDAEVLSLFAQAIKFSKGLPVGAIRLIFKSLFACTLEMIKANFEDFPEARLNFFKLLRAINQYNFNEFFNLDDNPAAAEAEFKLIINAIVWAFKHTERNVAETGLMLLIELLENVDKSAFVTYFYTICFRLVLNDILSVLTDTLHRPGFKYQAQVLMHLLSVVAAGRVTEPMWNPDNPEEVANSGNPPNNRQFVVYHMETLLTTAFPNLTRTQVQAVVRNMFESLGNTKIFKGHLRDFLIQTKEFGSGDNSDLFDEERKAELERKQREEQERLKSTPVGSSKQSPQRIFEGAH